MRHFTVLVVALAAAGCATSLLVRQADLDAWVGVPVVALDTHSLFLTIPVVRTVTDTGIEIRNYVNKQGVSSCFGNVQGSGQSNTRISGNTPAAGTGRVAGQAYTTSSANFSSFQNCSSRLVGCDNLFYIKDGKVIEYRPTGRCFTNQTVQPQPGWERFGDATSTPK